MHCVERLVRSALRSMQLVDFDSLLVSHAQLLVELIETIHSLQNNLRCPMCDDCVSMYTRERLIGWDKSFIKSASQAIIGQIDRNNLQFAKEIVRTNA